ncbi:MAG TPA: FG-GAP-like repeat-containing protein [Candidatus Polarisedimenticolaceae bacterium]|nr:FG-GAP-like repeat-containing protein [Candidatus Polarisedimenticolaceae bacterium]
MMIASARSLPAVSCCLTLLWSGCGGGNGGRGEPAGVPEEVIRHNIRGTAYLGQQKWAEAEAAFQQALDLRPHDALLANNQAVALIQQGRNDEAEQTLRRAIGESPDSPHARYNLGTILKNRGEFEAAAEQFEAVEAIDPDDLMTHYNLGVLYSRIGREADAEMQYRRALELDPTHVSTLYGLGRLLLQQGDQQRGVELISQSQAIRARSGLDEAVGTQYGEQGPYAMGADFPGDALAAPPPIEVEFDQSARAALASDRPPRAFVIGPAGAARDAVLYLVDGDGSIRVLDGGGLGQAWPIGRPVWSIAVGDVDRDGTPEVIALAGDPNGLRPIVAARDGRVTEVAEPVPTPSGVAASALALVDQDHDGDLDLFFCWTAAAITDCAIATNAGSGRFTVAPASDHGFSPRHLPDADRLSVDFSDVDNDRDVDLLLARRGRIDLFVNQREGRFEETSDAAGVGAVFPAADGALSVADVDKNGFMDLVAGVDRGTQVLANTGGRFDPGVVLAGGPTEGSPNVVLDYDNDGFLDLASGGPDGVSLYRNLGAGEWETGGRRLTDRDGWPLAALDWDADGDLDLAILDRGESPAVVRLANRGGDRNRHIRIVSRGVGDNRDGVGAKVELLAGALRQKFEIKTAVPLHAGLGTRDRVESARYLWPSGVLQDEIDLPAGQPVEVTQLDRKGTSCPLLYAWRDGAWRFVTDFLGGSAIGYLHAPGVYGRPDTDEYVKIEGGLSPAADGSLRLRLNNQLQEVIWFDQTRLIVVDHPAGTEVFPDERLMPGPPFPAFRLWAADDLRPLARATSVGDGADLTAVLAERDRRYARNFELLPFKGYATEHTVELDLGRGLSRGERIVLLLDGWIDYADSSANLAAHQAGRRLVPPELTVADGRGGWRSTDHRMGFPAGLPKTMAVELSGLFPSDDLRVRIRTTMRIYWDRARVLVGGEDVELVVRVVEPSAARLEAGGYPAPTSPDGAPPFGYDPAAVSFRSPWTAHVGRYTPFGDVTPLLRAIDDRFVTTRSGDQIELRFAAPDGPAAGMERTFLLFADGFGKDMDLNSAASDTVGPVPFHGMSAYPYSAGITPPNAGPAEGAAGRLVLDSDRGAPGAVPLALVTEDVAGPR